MSATAFSLIGVTVTACVTIMGWYIVNYLTTRREDLTRKAESRKKYIERQIEEFYGPLFNLTQQLESVREIREKILTAKWQMEKKGNDDKEIIEIKSFLRTEFVRPIYAAMGAILTDKLYLLDKKEIPQSFRQFLSHAVQDDAQKRLWVKKNISTIKVRGTPYPNEFSKDIAASLAQAMDEYRTIQGRTKIS